jgi:hypothetical protein
MPEIALISDDALKAARESLEDLAKDEYGLTLDDLFADDDPVRGNEYETMEVRESHDAMWRVGRLVGITVKEPFATTRPRGDNDESQTGARRVWNLEANRLGSAHPDWWQYNLIAAFLATEGRSGYFDWLPPKNLPEVEQVAWFLERAQTERGVFGALVKGARKYLCKPDIRAALASSGVPAKDPGKALDGPPREEVKPGSKGRLSADPVQTVVVGMTSSTASIVVAAVPWLGPTMAPFVGGLLLIIAVKGVNSLCSRAVPAPATYLVET